MALMFQALKYEQGQRAQALKGKLDTVFKQT
jgi:hypothetical protein